MDNRLIISDFYNNILLGFYFINDELYRIQNFSDNSLIGNIYCGYVKDVVKNIDAAFVEFGDNLKGFLSLKNIEKKPKSNDFAFSLFLHCIQRFQASCRAGSILRGSK